MRFGGFGYDHSFGAGNYGAGTVTGLAEALFARMAVQPSTARKTIIRTLINGLNDNGFLAKLRMFYVFAAHDSQAAQLNWAYGATITPVNSPTFTTDRGFQGNGTSSYLQGVGTGTFAADSGHMGCWVLTNNTGAYPAIGDSSLATYIMPQRLAVTVRGRLGGAAASDFLLLSATSVGHTVVSRTSTPTLSGYKNGTLLSAAANTGTSSSAALRVLNGSASYSPDQVAAVHAGAGLTDAEVTTLYGLINTYLTAVGAA